MDMRLHPYRVRSHIHGFSHGLKRATGTFETVEKPLAGFSDKLLQSAARTICSPQANKSHTYSLSCIFCQVHAPTENDLTLFADFRRQTLRGFFDTLKRATGTFS